MTKEEFDVLPEDSKMGVTCSIVLNMMETGKLTDILDLVALLMRILSLRETLTFMAFVKEMEIITFTSGTNIAIGPMGKMILEIAKAEDAAKFN